MSNFLFVLLQCARGKKYSWGVLRPKSLVFGMYVWRCPKPLKSSWEILHSLRHIALLIRFWYVILKDMSNFLWIRLLSSRQIHRESFSERWLVSERWMSQFKERQASHLVAFARFFSRYVQYFCSAFWVVWEAERWFVSHTFCGIRSCG